MYDVSKVATAAISPPPLQAARPLPTTYCRSDRSRASIVPKDRPAAIGRESCRSASAQSRTYARSLGLVWVDIVVYNAETHRR
jgi:hypothetical protein